MTMTEKTTDHIFNPLARNKLFYESNIVRKQVLQNLINDYFEK